MKIFKLFLYSSLRVIQDAGTIGIKGLLMQALSSKAKTFYEKLGFEASLIDPMMLSNCKEITLNNLKAAVTQ